MPEEKAGADPSSVKAWSSSFKSLSKGNIPSRASVKPQVGSPPVQGIINETLLGTTDSAQGSLKGGGEELLRT
jgi:hypothetical protein